MILHDSARYRFGVAVRAIVAVGGGYLLTALTSASMALLLPLPRADAALVATMSSFLVYACATLWVFATRTAMRAFTGMLLAVLVSGLVVTLAGAGLSWPGGSAA